MTNTDYLQIDPVVDNSITSINRLVNQINRRNAEIAQKLISLQDKEVASDEVKLLVDQTGAAGNVSDAIEAPPTDYTAIYFARVIATLIKKVNDINHKLRQRGIFFPNE